MHGYGMTSGKQRPILEVGVGPKTSLLPLQQIRQRFDGVRGTIYYKQLDSQKVGDATIS